MRPQVTLSAQQVTLSAQQVTLLLGLLEWLRVTNSQIIYISHFPLHRALELIELEQA